MTFEAGGDFCFCFGEASWERGTDACPGGKSDLWTSCDKVTSLALTVSLSSDNGGSLLEHRFLLVWLPDFYESHDSFTDFKILFIAHT